MKSFSSVQSISELVGAASASDRPRRQATITILPDPSELAQKDFFAELKAKIVFEAKIILVGQYTVGKSTLVHRLIGLSETLEERGGISAYLFDPDVVTPLTPKRPTLYRKNGMLVGHTGQRITPEDVAKMLAED